MITMAHKPEDGSSSEKCIVYLSPIYPSVSETFVIDELRMLGSVIPTKLISIRKGCNSATAAEDVEWCGAVYDRNLLALLLSGIFVLLNSERRLTACTALMQDLLCVSGAMAKVKLVYQFFAGAYLSKKLKRENCVHLHIHFAHVPATIGMYACALLGTPFTVMGHANDIFERPILLPQKAARARKFFTISDYNKKYLVESGLPEEKISVVRCVPGLRFSSEPSQSRHINPQKIKVVGSLGRLVEKKGMSVLIGAMDRLTRQGYSVRLEVAGDGPLMQRLSEQVESLGLQAEVDFLGAMPHAAVAEWMRNLDVFVLACVKDSKGDVDGIPVSLMEAMSQGVPVVSTCISGIPELVMHKQTGLLVAPHDTDALASALTQLLEEPDLGVTLARNAREWLSDEFGRKANLRRLVCGMGLSI